MYFTKSKKLKNKTKPLTFNHEETVFKIAVQPLKYQVAIRNNGVLNEMRFPGLDPTTDKGRY